LKRQVHERKDKATVQIQIGTLQLQIFRRSCGGNLLCFIICIICMSHIL